MTAVGHADPWRRGFALGGLLALAAPGAWAQAALAAQPASAAPPAMPAELLRTGLYLVRGGGSSTLLRLSAAGIVLVDGKAPGEYRALRRQVARINRLGDLPLRVLFLTDLQAAHAGNVESFRAAGVAVVVPRRAAAALASAGTAGGPAPVVPFDTDYHLQLGGVPVRALHVGPAKTADSTVVHFPDLKVLAVGDLLPPAAPLPEHAAGGSLVGWVAALDRALALDAELIVPGEGPPVARAQLEVFKARLETLVMRGRALLDEGADPDRFVAGLRAAVPDWPLDLSAAQWAAWRADLGLGR